MTKAEIQLVRALADKRGRTEHGLFVADEFLPFGHEQSVFRASAFVGQRADELYFGFRHRCFSMVKVTPSVAG